MIEQSRMVLDDGLSGYRHEIERQSFEMLRPWARRRPRMPNRLAPMIE